VARRPRRRARAQPGDAGAARRLKKEIVVHSDPALTAAAPVARPARSPIAWVPTLYFLQGLPFFVVAAMATFLLNDIGMPNDQVTNWVNNLGWAWVFKPLWSPLLETVASKKTLVVVFQLIGGATLAAVAMALNVPSSFALLIGILGFTAVASATHDIAADGLYIASLSHRQQAAFAGWQGAAFNLARLFSKGGCLWLVDYLARTSSHPHAWSIVFALMAATMVAVGLYHTWALPDTRSGAPARSMSAVWSTFGEVVVDFFRKPGIVFAIAFIILFRVSEGQLQSVAPLFLRAGRAAGGLGLSLSEVGLVYGTGATIAFLLGSVVGGYFVAWRGLRRAMVPLVLAMNIPNLVYWWLSVAQPTSLLTIGASLSLEMFGYGFGCVGIILFIMQVVAVGRFSTAHYALGSGVMQLGLILSGKYSGKLQMAIGYDRFFLWTLASALPILVMAFVFRRSTPSAAETAAASAVAA
jgi:MFS transporter, PAT family, beta-lactamase induction signal transducer AmpG